MKPKDYTLKRPNATRSMNYNRNSQQVEPLENYLTSKNINRKEAEQVGNSREHAQNPCGQSGLIELEEKMAEFYVTE